MTFLKFVCVSSCIGGLIPLMASAESLPSIVEQLATPLDAEQIGVSLESPLLGNGEDDLFLTHPQPISQWSRHAIDTFDQAVYSTRPLTFSLQFFHQDEDVAFLNGFQGDSVQSIFSVDGQLDGATPKISEHYPNTTFRVDEKTRPDPIVQVFLVSSEHLGDSINNTPFTLNTNQHTPYDEISLKLCTLEVADFPANEGNQNVAPRPIAQVRVNNYVIAEFDEQEQAYHFAEAVHALITVEGFDPTALKPRFENGDAVIAASYGSVRIIDTVSGLLGQAQDSVAIAWTNNLRVALGTEPLSMGDAQAHLQSLNTNGRSVNGTASWYGPYFHGRTTASGEPFDQNELTAAHPTLPFDTFLKVTNGKNGRSVIVRINDRGPYVGRRTLDLSRRAAQCLGSEEDGVVPYTATVLERKPGTYTLARRADFN